jgi:hypothetical protein
MPSTLDDTAVLSVVKKAMGAKFGVNNRDTTPKLHLYEDGN